MVIDLTGIDITIDHNDRYGDPDVPEYGFYLLNSRPHNFPSVLQTPLDIDEGDFLVGTNLMYLFIRDYTTFLKESPTERCVCPACGSDCYRNMPKIVGNWSIMSVARRVLDTKVMIEAVDIIECFNIQKRYPCTDVKNEFFIEYLERINYLLNKYFRDPKIGFTRQSSPVLKLVYVANLILGLTTLDAKIVMRSFRKL